MAMENDNFKQERPIPLLHLVFDDNWPTFTRPNNARLLVVSKLGQTFKGVSRWGVVGRWEPCTTLLSTCGVE